MFEFLRNLTKSVVRVPSTPAPVPSAFGTANLRRKLTCRMCGSAMLLRRFVLLHPSGVRGDYSCANGHVAAIKRDGVRQCVHEAVDRIWFD